MRNSLILTGCLGILFACNGAEDKKNAEPADYSNTATEQIRDEGEGVQGISEGEIRTKNNKVTKDSLAEKESSEEIKNTDNVETTGTKETTEVNVAVEETTTKEEKQVQDKTILINVVPDEMKYDKEVFTVTAGQKVTIELDNLDGMEHNLVISKPGTLEKVGAAADVLARDPKGAQKHYVPEIPEVLFATKMLNPGEFAILTFTAPKEPGEYPFVCTFPGHWRMMNGIMKVVEAE